MELWVNHTFQENMVYTNGGHYYAYFPEPGDTLIIKAIIKGVTVLAKTFVPQKVEITAVSYQKGGFIDNEYW
jgi:hypothetical protein